MFTEMHWSWMFAVAMCPGMVRLFVSFCSSGCFVCLDSCSITESLPVEFVLRLFVFRVGCLVALLWIYFLVDRICA